MRSQKSLIAGVMFSLLSSGVMVAGDARPSREAQATGRRATQAQTPRRSVEFKTERTDSWLCNHVSVLFCTNLFPTLPTTPSGGTTPAGAPPDRSRQ